MATRPPTQSGAGAGAGTGTENRAGSEDRTNKTVKTAEAGETAETAETAEGRTDHALVDTVPTSVVRSDSPDGEPAGAGAGIGAETGAEAGVAEQGHPRRWWGLAVILATGALEMLDTMIVQVAAPYIKEDFGASSAQMQWTAASYTLAFAMLLVTGSRLGDIVGRKRMLNIGIAGFTVFSVVSALATGPGMLIAARCLQGAAAGLMAPQGLALLRSMFPPSQRSAAFAAFGPVMGLATVLGPVLGGIITSADLFGSGWRMIFLINAPVGVAALVASVVTMPENKSRNVTRLDIMGAVMVSVATLLLVYPLVQGHDQDWPPWIFVLLALSLPAFVVFALHLRRRQRRRVRTGRAPLIEPTLFRNRAFVASLVVGVAFYSGLSGMTMATTYYLQSLGYTALHTGLTLVPWSIGTTVGAGLAGAWLGPKYGRRTLHAGLVVTGAGMVAMAAAAKSSGLDATSWELAPSLLVTGLGLGLLMAPFISIALGDISDHEAGSASGTLNAIQQLAYALGTAVFGSLYFSLADSGPVHAVQRTMWAVTAAFGAAFVCAFLMPRQARQRAEEE
ncbi:MFS transporter [Streptomyces sp. NPDC093510]|uniref:MFS transporter n=1 Tax=Streptomyces sp. NPDC093510 TaxID=3155199 RepID=UPI00342E5694